MCVIHVRSINTQLYRCIHLNTSCKAMKYNIRCTRVNCLHLKIWCFLWTTMITDRPITSPVVHTHGMILWSSIGGGTGGGICPPPPNSTKFLGTRPFNWSSKVTRGDRWCCYCQMVENMHCAWSILEAILGSFGRFLDAFIMKVATLWCHYACTIVNICPSKENFLPPPLKHACMLHYPSCSRTY